MSKYLVVQCKHCGNWRMVISKSFEQLKKYRFTCRRERCAKSCKLFDTKGYTLNTREVENICTASKLVGELNKDRFKNQ